MAVTSAVKSELSTLDVAFEDYSMKPVPSRVTRGWFDLGMIMIGFLFAIPAFMVGGQMATGGGMGRAILAIFIGALVVTVISVGSGIIGAQTRLSTAMSTQFTFGRKMNGVLAVLMAASAFGWFGVQLEVAANALRGAVTLATGNSATPIWVFVLIGGALMVLTALYGVKTLSLLSNVAIPLAAGDDGRHSDRRRQGVLDRPGLRLCSGHPPCLSAPWSPS